jgi:hypothetical protein
MKKSHYHFQIIFFYSEPKSETISPENEDIMKTLVNQKWNYQVEIDNWNFGERIHTEDFNNLKI